MVSLMQIVIGTRFHIAGHATVGSAKEFTDLNEVDCMARLERFDEDLPAILENIGMKNQGEIPRRNSSKDENRV